MKNTILIIGLFFLFLSSFTYSQNEILKSPISKGINLEKDNSRGYLFKQFEFPVPKDNGFVAIGSDGEYFYLGRFIGPGITRFDLEGNQINHLVISGIPYCTSLVYDGRYFWGALMSNTIHKIDMQANPPVSVGTIHAPFEVIHCTFDPSADEGNGGLWIGGWDTDLILVNLDGGELRRISANTHGLSTTIATALDNVNPGGPYLWTISSSENTPPMMIQLNYETGEQTGEIFNLFTEGFTNPTDNGGGMFVISDIVAGTTSLVVLIQNSKVLGFDLGVIQGKPLDIGVYSLDIQGYMPNIPDFSVSGKIKNFGNETITSFNISYQIDDDEVQTYEVTGVNLTAGNIYQFTHPTTVEQVVGNHKISVWTSLPNGEDDMYPANDKFEFSYIVYDEIIARPRTILMEGFTSSTCEDCVQGNSNLKNVLHQNQGFYSFINYQMNWPNNGDPYYTSEAGARRDFYNVNTLPKIYIDGTTFEKNTSSLDNEDLVKLQNIPAYMELDVDYYIEGQTVYVKTKITPTIDFSNTNLRLQMAIVEKKTYNNWQTLPYQSNGEREFIHVMKKFMPNANGIIIGDLTAETSVEFEQEWEFKGDYKKPNNAFTPINHSIENSVEDFSNLVVISWVQNRQDKTILQACNGVQIKEPLYFVKFNSVGGNGIVTATVDGEEIGSNDLVEKGMEVVFTAVPNSGYEVKEWRINGIVVSGNTTNQLITILDKNFNVTVEFQTTHLLVNYFVINNEFGTLTATVDDKDIVSGDLVLRKSKVIFTANPDKCYKVKEWKNNGNIIYGNTMNKYTLESLTNDINVSVEFLFNCFNVSYNTINEFGNIEATVGEEHIVSGEFVEYGSKIIFTAKPDDGYEVSEWKNNGAVVFNNNTNEFIIQSLNVEAEVTVEFREKTVINNCELSMIKLFPNPFKNEIFISSPAMVKSVEITNATGQKLKEVIFDGKSISTREIANGVYFVVIESITGEKATYKVVKK